jgi:HAD superfamily hydrolase (TIGR01509 family)
MRYYVERFRLHYPKSTDFDALASKLHKAKTAYYNRMLQEGGIPLRPGVKRLLEEARAASLMLGIATTTTPENVTTLLRYSLAADSVDWFAVIAAGDVVPAKKPAPDIYLLAMERLGLKPQECIAFEDSRNGILASLGAGLKTVITVNGYTQHEDFTGALAVLSDLGEPDAPYTRLDTDGRGERSYVNLERLQNWFANSQGKSVAANTL